MIVPESLFGVAAGAGDGEVFEVVGAAVVLGDDMLEGGPVDRCAIGPEGELSLSMNTLAFEDLLTI